MHLHDAIYKFDFGACHCGQPHNFSLTWGIGESGLDYFASRTGLTAHRNEVIREDFDRQCEHCDRFAEYTRLDVAVILRERIEQVQRRVVTTSKVII